MSNLEAHAERELKKAGLYDADADFGGMIPAAVMELVRTHAKQGHSGGSHELALEIFNRVVNFKTLSPITSDPEEWNDVSAASGHPFWQNRRQPSVFSKDGGKTWYDIDAPVTPPAPEPVPSDADVEAECEKLVATGDLERVERPDGTKAYRITPQGSAKVEADLRAAGIDPDQLKKG